MYLFIGYIIFIKLLTNNLNFTDDSIILLDSKVELIDINIKTLCDSTSYDDRSYYDKSGSSSLDKKIILSNELSYNIVSKDDSLDKKIVLANDLSNNITLTFSNNSIYNSTSISNYIEDNNFSKNDDDNLSKKLDKESTLNTAYDNLELNKKSLFSSFSEQEKHSLRIERARSDPIYKQEAIEMYYKEKKEISELNKESEDFQTKKDDIIKKCTNYLDDKYF